MNLSELAHLYISTHVISRTYAAEILRTARRFESAIGSCEISQLGPREIASFTRWLIAHTGNANTQWHYVARLKILLSFAKTLKLLSELPPIPKISRPHRMPHAWTLEEFQRLYAVANQLPGRVGVQLARIWWPSLIAAAYHTASRIGALLKASWGDLDLTRKIIVLRAENTKTKREQIFVLPDYVIGKIKEMRWPKREFIWEWPYSRRYFFRRFRMILRAAELEPEPWVRFGLFHQIRRTAATVATERHGLQAAQRLLGHTSARITLEHYVDPTLVVCSVKLPSLE